MIVYTTNNVVILVVLMEVVVVEVVVDFFSMVVVVVVVLVVVLVDIVVDELDPGLDAVGGRELRYRLDPVKGGELSDLGLDPVGVDFVLVVDVVVEVFSAPGLGPLGDGVFSDSIGFVIIAVVLV